MLPGRSDRRLPAQPTKKPRTLARPGLPMVPKDYFLASALLRR